MDEVGSASSSLVEVQHHQCINVVHDIREKLEKLEPPISVECYIYKVPDYLRKSKEAGVALGKSEVGDRFKPHLKIRFHPKFF